MLLLVASAFAWDPPRLYVGGHLPITSFGITTAGTPYVQLDLVPIALEARIASRVGLRLAADSPLIIGIRTPQTIGAVVQAELPIYLGDYAPVDGMRGFYIGPYVATAVFDDVEIGGGATLGISSRLSDRIRIRTGGTLGVMVAPESSALRVDLRFSLLEIGGFVF